MAPVEDEAAWSDDEGDDADDSSEEAVGEDEEAVVEAVTTREPKAKSKPSAMVETGAQR